MTNFRPATLQGDRIKFTGALLHQCYFKSLPSIRRWELARLPSLHLDFSDVTGATADGLLGLIATIDSARQRLGPTISITLPTDDMSRRLFLNTNWAHLLAPDRFPPSNRLLLKHLPAIRFTSYESQNEALNLLYDVIFRKVKLSVQHQEALEWSIAELTDNVLTHASAFHGGLLQATALAGYVEFTVADAGVGVLASMASSYPDITSDQQAVTRAIEEGVSGRPAENQGNGLAGSLQLAIESHGRFGISSGRGNYYADFQDGHAQTEYSETQPPLESHTGTIVTVRIGSSVDFQAARTLSRVTGRNAPSFLFLEERFGTLNPDVLRLNVGQLTNRTWSRASGREGRILIHNMLQRSATTSVEIDWSDVTKAASSFVDELVGKLLQEMGVNMFLRRIRLVGLSGIPRILVERALARRSSESLPLPAGDSEAAT